MDSNKEGNMTSYYLKRNRSFRKRYYAKCRMAMLLVTVLIAVCCNVHFYYLITVRNALRTLKGELMSQRESVLKEKEALNGLIEESYLRRSRLEQEVAQSGSEEETALKRIEVMRLQIEQNERKVLSIENELVELEKGNSELQSKWQILNAN